MTKLNKHSPIAHVKCDELGAWLSPHELEEHLIKTAKLAQQFADPIGAEWGELAGRWHDLGKFRQRFQDYIRLASGFERENAHIENAGRAPHSTAGAIHAVRNMPPGFGHVLAYIIAGHHAGLPDYFNGKGSLEHRLSDGVNEYKEALASNIPEYILQSKSILPPSFARDPGQIALWIRMLFSCLVDADFLDTESYMSPEKRLDRKSNLDVGELWQRFERKMSELQANSNDSELNQIRGSIYQACINASSWPPGLFSLTVPTGGGKTLSSLAFALQHAKKFNKKRIIYAIPFTSIIEQNAEVFRQFLGDDAILEHHSSLDVDPAQENLRNRLATENWDAPLIVTTNVQLFESLHASRTSRCRKLHNLIDSVIVLDEAQQLPRDFHAPITKVMQQLSDSYGVSWVLCTATQPVLDEEINTFGQKLLSGLKNVREIVESPTELAQQLKRVQVHMPRVDDPKLSWNALAEKLLEHDCVLTIVNTRKQARVLAELLNDEEDCLHLSANMCAQHRSHVISEIKLRLQARRKGDSRPLRVISTQLIEAGVDVDFPVVFRSLAGLDSIAQSAGRCNREGKLLMGQVYVFKPEEPSPPGFLQQGEAATVELLATGALEEPLAPESFKAYFKLLNSKGERDKHNINALLRASSTADAPLAIQFREAAEKFRLIDNKGEPIIVPFVPEGEDESPVEGWLEQLERDPSQKWVYKKLQRFTVTVPEHLINKYFDHGCVENRAGLTVLLSIYYHRRWGADLAEKMASAEESVF